MKKHSIQRGHRALIRFNINSVNLWVSSNDEDKKKREKKPQTFLIYLDWKREKTTKYTKYNCHSVFAAG